MQPALNDSIVEKSHADALLLSDQKFLLIGVLLQIGLSLFAFALQHQVLFYASLLTLMVWFICVVLFVRRNQTCVDYLSSLAWFSLVINATLLFSIQSGVHLLLWPLACTFITNPRVGSVFSMLFASLCLIAFIQLSLTHDPKNLFPDLGSKQLETIALTRISIETFTLLMSVSTAFFILVGGAFLVDIVLRMKTSFLDKQKTLDQIAHTDSLTGIANRRYFINFIEKQSKMVLHNGQPYCIALGDVDHFKRINDTLGHDIGDKVLKKLAACFTSILSQSDKVCRWGGEEFLLFIPNSKLQDTYLVIECIREVISELQVNDVGITMSFGIAENNGELRVEELVKRADILLYEAKKQGRNNTQI